MAIRRNKPPKSNSKVTRKQLRKDKRKGKKIKRNEFYRNRNKPGKFVLNPNKSSSNNIKEQKTADFKKQKVKNDTVSNKVLSIEAIRNKEQKEKNKLQKEMTKQRMKQLLDANVDEDRNIKQLEKHLKLNKRKSKSIPKSFTEDGLDYLLEVCDSETMSSTIATEQELNEANNEFEEDFTLMTGQANGTKEKENDSSIEDTDSDEDMNSESEQLSEEENDDINDQSEDEDMNGESEELSEEENDNINDQSEYETDSETVENEKYSTKKEKVKEQKSKNNVGEVGKATKRKKGKGSNTSPTRDKKVKLNSLDTNPAVEGDISNEDQVSESEKNFDTEGTMKQNEDGTWEDIYGRLRTNDGAIVTKSEEKYIPPTIRAKLETNVSQDKTRIESLNRLKKQLKGLLNRLAESNMHNIASQIENMYMNNSRNDMSETLTNLMMESLVSEVITPERLLIEHVVLIIVLHANVGTEVGAHFLQSVVKKFEEFVNANHDVENKKLDNIVNIISQLYNFKLFDAKLLYEMLYKLSSKFEEKDVECILHILKSVGFTLRKDDPIALKNFILDIQKRAGAASEEVKDNPRVKFMLDILLAIKNNNVTKIPNYDTSYSEHLKKIMKAFIRKGNYVTQLNISLEDLLKADERGRWWVVGSAWTGNTQNIDKLGKSAKADGFSEKLLLLAKKQRMNTNTRRNIFCIIMSAEDYLDAFEKLLHLNLKNQQEREIINIILHCCLQEKQYNPYYAVLAQKFCEYDRKYQMNIKCSIWDKLKSLGEHSGSQLSNLAKMLTHLFIEKGLPISTLKIVEFGELDKITLRFMRQILLGILLHKDLNTCLSVFEKVAQSEKLKLFRESLRLFIHHFLLRNLKSESIPEEQKSLLESRSKMVEKVLMSKESKIKF
ncbi:nucleolar MIF4G domain-containing protein 1 homolog [Anoplophora glabripennis]|nr:nucleolar MIF4G domain-containing protein 1 homolog [Anoplophora glabripennis]